MFPLFPVPPSLWLSPHGRGNIRSQPFPDWYKFAGKRTTGRIRRAGNPRKGIHDRELPKYTQIGNSVPVLPAKAVGGHFKQLFGY